MTNQEIQIYRLLMIRASAIFADLAESTLNQMIRTVSSEADHVTRKHLQNASVHLGKAVDKLRDGITPEWADQENGIEQSILEIAVNMQQLKKEDIEYLENESHRLLALRAEERQIFTA